MDRRKFLASNLGLCLVSMLGCSQKTVKADQLVFSGCTDTQNQHYAAAFTPEGECYFIQPIPERSHHSEYLPNQGQVLFFDRSPGTHFYVIDIDSKKLVQTITAPENRYYSGHGVIDKDNRLFVTENDATTHEGYIGIYEPNNGYTRTGDFPTHGIEPHQLLLKPNSNELIVANGGLIKIDGEIINTDNFESTVVYLNTQTGSLIKQYFAPDPQNSLRHMAISDEGTMFVGAQSYNPNTIPLIFQHTNEEKLIPFEADEFMWDAHNQYTASLAVKGNTLAVTSPRGNITSFWDVKENSFIQQKAFQDCAGIVTLEHNKNLFTVTSGIGSIVKVKDKQPGISTDRVLQDAEISNLSWDNHLSFHTFI